MYGGSSEGIVLIGEVIMKRVINLGIVNPEIATTAYKTYTKCQGMILRRRIQTPVSCTYLCQKHGLQIATGFIIKNISM